MLPDLPILLVEDNNAVRSVFARHLTAEGYSLVIAATAVEAIRLIEHDRQRFALAVVDFVLPAPGVAPVIEALRHTMSPLRVLLMSALPENIVRRSPLVAALQQEPRFCFMGKPFSLASFSRSVEELLESDDPTIEVATGEWPIRP
ncbi:MAG TPA: response regulator [Gemmatimonadaceae bacterium]